MTARNAELKLVAFFQLLILGHVLIVRSIVHDIGDCAATYNDEDTRSTHVSGTSEGGDQSYLRNFQTWIVRFHKYQDVSYYYQLLSEGLQGEKSSWHWIPRENAAQDFPTDFGLIYVDQHLHLNIIKDLKRLGDVKDVHLDRRLEGYLNWKPEGPLKDLLVDGHTTSAFTDEATKFAKAKKKGRPKRRDAVSKGPAVNGDSFGPTSQQDITEPDFSVSKHPGRFSTKFMMDEDRESFELGGIGGENLQENESLIEEASSESQANSSATDFNGQQQRRKLRLLTGSSLVTRMLQADRVWELGYSGDGVKVGIFDTGIRGDHPHIRNIRERTNWTHQKSLDDGLGHGSFVAGVIGSKDRECPGFAPDVGVYTFKVFTDDQVSFTSWFLDAFNYAIYARVNIINLSIGGPDFLDQPFVDKIQEVTSSGIIMISAIGNDGPLYGTLNNPADQNDVIGIGGIDNAGNMASFSSRGMTTWELPTGSGRLKPDIVAYSRGVSGSKMRSGCRSLSGTSVASPVVAGAVCLLASTVPARSRWDLLNPASMKQALVEGATKLPKINMYEQGAGRINVLQSMKILQSYQLRASIVPAVLDLKDCPYTWPYCTQPLYAGAMPMIFNTTILNPLGVSGRLESRPVYTAADEAGRQLHVDFEYSEILWPWSGNLALFIRVRPSASGYQGDASGLVSFNVTSPPSIGETVPRRSLVSMPIRVRIIPTPPRHKRILWDQFHNIKYPPGYIPRDNLDIKSDVLDWHGDHPYTNFHKAFDYLVAKGYHVELLASPFTCFDASQYGALILADPEEEYYPQEVVKIAEDVEKHGLNLIVFGEWYNINSIKQLRFFDDNTRSWWTPVTGGANVPALNELLAPFGVAFGDAVLVGDLNVAGMRPALYHGADIAKLPAGAYLHSSNVKDMANKAATSLHGLLGVVPRGVAGGHVVVFGDSNCLDMSHQRSSCYDFLHRIIERVAEKKANGIAGESNRLTEAYQKVDFRLPERLKVDFTEFSYVLKNDIRCYKNAPCEFLRDAGCIESGISSQPTVTGITDNSWLFNPPVPEEEPDIIVKGLKPNTNSMSGTGQPDLTGWMPQASEVIRKATDVRPLGFGIGAVYVVMLFCVGGLAVVISIWNCSGRLKRPKAVSKTPVGVI